MRKAFEGGGGGSSSSGSSDHPKRRATAGGRAGSGGNSAQGTKRRAAEKGGSSGSSSSSSRGDSKHWAVHAEGGDGSDGSTSTKKGGKEKGKGKGRATTSSGTGDDAASTAGADDHRMVIKEELTAEMLFPAAEEDSPPNHRGKMDDDTFMEWIKKRLVPTFKKLYPGFKIILVLDNAPYHHGMPAGWENPFRASRETNLATLRSLVKEGVKLDREEGRTVDGIVTTRSEETIFFPLPREGETSSPSPSGLTSQEVRCATYRILKKNAPHKLETRAEAYFREEDVGQLLYTPPYCPNVQPMERFWPQGDDVAGGFEPRRSLTDVCKGLRRAWYGDAARGGGVNCAKLVKHSLEYAAHLFEQQDLKGEIDADAGTMTVDPDSMRYFYWTSKRERMERAPGEEDAAVEKQAHDDEGPRLLGEVTLRGDS